MKVFTVHSDGTPRGTQIIDEDGKVVENVFEAEIYLDARDVPRLTLHMHPVNINIQNGHFKGAEFRCPGCDETLSHECKP